MALDIIVKANDGRGMGHIGRVRNWIDYLLFNSSIGIIAHNEYANLVPQRVANILVKDEGFRVDLDSAQIWEKWTPHNRTQGIAKEEAINNYYFSLLDMLTNGSGKLVYIDDQNAPETPFMKNIGSIIGKPILDIEDLSPGSRIAFEIETQIWDRNGNESMGKTREECFRKADYLHLSSDADFMRQVVGKYEFTPGNQNVIPMGFPLAKSSRELFDNIKSNPNLREGIINDLYDKLGENNKKKSLAYSSFGAGEGASEVIDALCDVANNFADKVFVAGNPRDKLAIFAKQKGCNVVDRGAGVKKIQLDKGVVYLTDFGTIASHLELVAAADVLIQGNGSGTTYEGMAAQNPKINIPLDRPGYEQLIKALGVVLLGCGELLLLPKAEEQLKNLANLTATYGHTLNAAGKGLNADNLGGYLSNMLSNPNSYRNNLKAVQDFFADPVTTSNVIKDMAYGNCTAAQIIHRNKLKNYFI